MSCRTFQENIRRLNVHEVGGEIKFSRVKFKCSVADSKAPEWSKMQRSLSNLLYNFLRYTRFIYLQSDLSKKKQSHFFFSWFIYLFIYFENCKTLKITKWRLKQNQDKQVKHRFECSGPQSSLTPELLLNFNRYWKYVSLCVCPIANSNEQQKPINCVCTCHFFLALLSLFFMYLHWQPHGNKKKSLPNRLNSFPLALHRAGPTHMQRCQILSCLDNHETIWPTG